MRSHPQFLHGPGLSGRHGGEAPFGIPPLIPYPELRAGRGFGAPERWYDVSAEGSPQVLLFPYKTLAALAGPLLLPLVSRRDPPQALRKVDD